MEKRSFEQKQFNLWNLMQDVFLPIFIYYFVMNITAMAGVSFMEATAAKMLGMAVGGLSVCFFLKRELRFVNDRNCANKKSLSVKNLLFLGSLGAIFSLGINFLFSFIGFTQSSERYSQVAESQFALPLWLAVLFYGILSPLTEEIVFRGIVCNALVRITTPLFGIFGSAFLFGAFHGNVVQMVYGSLMGVIMAYVYQKYQKLLAPIVFHSAANIAIYVVTYFF